MNSVLQCLTHTPPLAELFLSKKEYGRNPRDPVTTTQQHIRKAFSSNSLRPSSHAESLRLINKRCVTLNPCAHIHAAVLSISCHWPCV